MRLLSQRHRRWQCFLSGTNICLSDEELMSASGANFVVYYNPCVICGAVVRVCVCLCVCWCSKPPGLFCKDGPKGKLSSSPLEEVFPPPPFSHTTKGHSQCFGSFATQNIFLSLSRPSVPTSLLVCEPEDTRLVLD